MEKGLMVLINNLMKAYDTEMKEEDLVEYTTEVIGFSGGKRTVKLTREQSREVELILDSIQKKLESSKSIEEAKEIYKNGVVELDKYGLLAGLSREEVRKLVPRDFPLNKRLGIHLEHFQNIFCLLFGTVYVPESYPGGIVFCYPISFLFLVGLIFGLNIGGSGRLYCFRSISEV